MLTPQVFLTLNVAPTIFSTLKLDPHNCLAFKNESLAFKVLGSSGSTFSAVPHDPGVGRGRQ